MVIFLNTTDDEKLVNTVSIKKVKTIEIIVLISMQVHAKSYCFYLLNNFQLSMSTWKKKLVTTSFRNTLEDSEMVFEIPREKERKNLPFGV